MMFILKELTTRTKIRLSIERFDRYILFVWALSHKQFTTSLLTHVLAWTSITKKSKRKARNLFVCLSVDPLSREPGTAWSWKASGVFLRTQERAVWRCLWEIILNTSAAMLSCTKRWRHGSLQHILPRGRSQKYFLQTGTALVTTTR